LACIYSTVKEVLIRSWISQIKLKRFAPAKLLAKITQ
jgi:hypothetical protein